MLFGGDGPLTGATVKHHALGQNRASVDYWNYFHFTRSFLHFSMKFSGNKITKSVLVALDRRHDLEYGVEQLERRKNNIVYILDVVEVEKLLKGGKLLLGNVVSASEDLISLFLGFFLGLKSQHRKHDRINVEQKSNASAL